MDDWTTDGQARQKPEAVPLQQIDSKRRPLKNRPLRKQVRLRPTVPRQPVMGSLLLIIPSVCPCAAAYPPLPLLPVAFR